jgi:primase-polymerase (primpol)-like protein
MTLHFIKNNLLKELKQYTQGIMWKLEGSSDQNKSPKFLYPTTNIRAGFTNPKSWSIMEYQKTISLLSGSVRAYTFESLWDGSTTEYTSSSEVNQT